MFFNNRTTNIQKKIDNTVKDLNNSKYKET